MNTKLKIKSKNNVKESFNNSLNLYRDFCKDLSKVRTISNLSLVIKITLKRIIPINECEIFLFNENYSNLLPISIDLNNDLTQEISQIYHKGILDNLFLRTKSPIISEVNCLKSDSEKSFSIIFPIFEEKKRKGIFVIITSINNKHLLKSFEDTIRLILESSISKMEYLFLKERMKNLCFDLEAYQAKIAKDSKILTIGHHAENLFQDILNPLQVIISYIDLIDDNVEKESIKRIKEQVHKIKGLIERVSKFASIDNDSKELKPIDINKTILSYRDFLKVAEQKLKTEIILDLDKNLPPILSSATHIFQLLTNVIGLLRTISTGVILIQTNTMDNDVQLKIITTEIIDLNKIICEDNSLSYRIIKNIMDKNEGQFFFENFSGSGTLFLMIFPIRKKIRK